MDPLDQLVGRSPAMEAFRQTLRRLATHPAAGRRQPAILLQGETGVGKGLVARLIHRAGARSEGPFVDVNCAAIPDTLLEAELFGFERGAFTDARRTKPGLFQTAHRGTIFLDEVGLLPEPLQAKLLSVIEERAVRKLGSTHPEPADAWIISATNVDLLAAVRARRFREDLYHRLAVVTLRIPPLRERNGDILMLADAFLARVCTEYALPPKSLGPEARERLLAHPWTGNVRELANVIERAALLTDGPVVKPNHLELSAHTAARAASPASSVETGAERVRAVLEETGWNISRAAAALGITRNTLRARIQKFGLRTTAVATPTHADPPASATAGADAHRGEPAPLREAAPLPASPATIRWERRRITLMRVGLIVAESPDEVPDTSRALELLVSKVETFGGRIEEVGQTGLDASFGLEPIEDAPRRAANAALAILKAGERGRGRGFETLDARIAIHTAPYLVGLVAGVLQIDKAAKEETAAILQSLVTLGEPNSVAISAATVPFLERRFEIATEAGRDGPRYRLAGRETSGIGMFGRVSKFVGRHYELELLKSRWSAVLRGHGQVVALVGEPGVGKSRLLWEFTRSQDGNDRLLLQASSVALANPAPYLPVAELLRGYFDLHGPASRDNAEERIAARLRQLDETLTPAVPAFLALLDLPVRDPQWRELSPSQRRQRTFDAVRKLLLRESRRQPVTLVFEDVHWIDAETQALLDTLVDGLPTSRILLLLTCRPEYQHAWTRKTYYTQLRVDPLTPETAVELVASLLGEHHSVGPLKPLLIEWTEGNPFFLEEIVRTLVETAVLMGERADYRLTKPVTTIQVPATVEEVLAARIDWLAAEQRRLLQSAAVIGKDVPYPVLAAVADLPEEILGESLRKLQAAELLYESADAPELEYTFKHALTHEVAYASLVQGKRVLHARILDVMEELYADRPDEYIDRLAHHALRGQVWEKALTYLRRAGLKALARSANREAAVFFEQALEVVPRLPETPERQATAIDATCDLRNALTLIGEPRRTFERLRAAETLAERIGDQRRLGRVLCFEANCLFLLARHQEAILAGNRAFAIGTALDDFSLTAPAQQYVGRAHQALGHYARAIEIYERIVEALSGDRAREHFGLPVMPAVFSRSQLALCQLEVGLFEPALRHAEEAMRLADAETHPDSLVWGYRAKGLAHLARGEPEAARRVLDQALALCQTHDMPTYVARFMSELALAHAMSGDTSEGLSLGARAVESASAPDQAANLAGVVLRLGEVQLLAGLLDGAAASARRALELFRSQHERGNEAHALRLGADVASREAAADSSTAATMYQSSLHVADELGMRPLAARCRLGLGLLHGRRGAREAAHTHLTAALALLDELGMDFWRREARAQLAALG